MSRPTRSTISRANAANAELEALGNQQQQLDTETNGGPGRDG